MNSRAEYLRTLEEKLEGWNAEIDRLATKGGDISGEMASQLESLKGKQAEGREKVRELQQAGEGAWEDLKSGVELSWAAMGEAMSSARSRFK
jgi:hypothetical protein